MLSIRRTLAATLALSTSVAVFYSYSFNTTGTPKIPQIADVVPILPIVHSGILLISICNNFRKKMDSQGLWTEEDLESTSRIEGFCGPLLESEVVKHVLAIIEGVWGRGERL
jgi:hypothetical protein